MDAQDGVLRQRERQHEAQFQTILGNVSKAETINLSRIDAENVDSVDGGCAGSRDAKAGQRFDQFGLAVPLDAGNAENFASVDVERYVIDCDFARVPSCYEVFHVQDASAGAVDCLAHFTDGQFLVA